MDKRRQTGHHGEDIAVRHLVGKGYKVVDRNWRCPIGELDIIMEDGDTLVFVEVRTVDVHIGRLRKALTKYGQGDPIRTVRSAGYALDALV